MEEKKIIFLDLKKQYLQLKKEILSSIENVLDENTFFDGKNVEKFEENFAKYCQSKHAVALNNGSSALHLALLAIGVGKGDEVIVPANTFIATAWAVNYVGATPVFVDCTNDTWQIDPTKIEQKITSKTKAIIGVHLYGQPFDISSVKKITESYNLFLVEDAAQAHGAFYNGNIIGNSDNLTCFSFYPTKNLGTYGEGGGITTNNSKYIPRLKKLRNYGSEVRYYHDEIGFNMRMGEIEAAVLNVKLKYLNSWNNQRKAIAKKYQTEIKNPKIKFQYQPSFSDSIYHLFVITTENRDELVKYLNKNNIFPGLHYPVPCHLQKAYSNLNYKIGDFENAEYLSNHCLSLPMYAELSNDELEKVINAINVF